MPIKCEYCGKFISYEDVENGNAKHVFCPDSHFSGEATYWICKKCKEKE